jgi:hypothetical protein
VTVERGDLVGVGIGGTIGSMSAYGLEALKRYWRSKDDRRRIDRLLEVLYEEVEQLAELIDVDLGLVESCDLDFILEFGKGSGENDGKLRATIARLQDNRTIYNSQAERFLDLPEYLPNALVRLYTRLQVNCDRMLGAIDKGDLEKIRELRSLSLAEAEALKIDLKRAGNERGGTQHEVEAGVEFRACYMALIQAPSFLSPSGPFGEGFQSRYRHVKRPFRGECLLPNRVYRDPNSSVRLH